MAQLTIMGLGDVVNAAAFSGSNALISMLSIAENEQRNKALAQLQIDRKKWTEKRAELEDLANKELQRQGHAQLSFRNVDDALQEYHNRH